MECLFWAFWVVLGDAETSFRFACLLVVFKKKGKCGGLEDGTYLPFLVFMEEEK